MHHCKTCGEDKALSEFYKRSSGSPKNECKSCMKARGIARSYGITIEEYRTKVEAQKGLCMICQKPGHVVWKKSDKRKHLSLDHDHETGLVRDFLCDRCNRGLGNFLDNPLLLEAAANYLRNWGK